MLLIFIVLEYVMHRKIDGIYVEMLGMIIDINTFRKITMYMNLLTYISHIIMYYIEYRRL